MLLLITVERRILGVIILLQTEETFRAPKDRRETSSAATGGCWWSACGVFADSAVGFFLTLQSNHKMTFCPGSADDIRAFRPDVLLPVLMKQHVSHERSLVSRRQKPGDSSPTMRRVKTNVKRVHAGCRSGKITVIIAPKVSVG